MSDERRFPIQGGLTVSWPAAERAYATYSKLYGTSQSLERLAERGGFGMLEFAGLYGRYDPRRVDDRRVAETLAVADVRPA